MFSAWARSFILVSIGLIGLLMLCVPMSRAQTDDTEKPVLSIYMTNAGAHLTFGTNLSPLPLYELNINTWDRTDLYGDPPNLAFNNSPLKFFRQLLSEAKPAILKQILAHKQWLDAPLQVYVAAAGADEAEKRSIPDRSILSFLTNSQETQCYRPELNRKEFYHCVFNFEIIEQLHKPLTPKLEMIVDQDTALINAMAWAHNPQKKVKQEQPSLVIHATTISQPYLMTEGQATPLEGWVMPSMRKKGGIYQIGEEFQSYLNTVETSELVDAVQHDHRSFNHPLGQEENLSRLKRGKGFNNYGRMVGETAVELNKHSLQEHGLNINSLAYQKALKLAMPMVAQARKAFIQLTLTLYARNEHLFGTQPPHIIIVGEESDILFPNQSVFISTAQSVISESKMGLGDWQLAITAKRPDLTDPENMQAWIETRSNHITRDVSILPANQFARFQHEASVSLLNRTRQH